MRVSDVSPAEERPGDDDDDDEEEEEEMGRRNE